MNAKLLLMLSLFVLAPVILPSSAVAGSEDWGACCILPEAKIKCEGPEKAFTGCVPSCEVPDILGRDLP